MNFLFEMICINWFLWSKIRWRNHTDLTYVSNRVYNLDSLKAFVKSVNSKFKYTPDDSSQLYDSIKPPQQVYREFKNGKLEDDCDGISACFHHVFNSNHLENYMIAIMPKKFLDKDNGSHVVSAVKIYDKWTIIDYDSIYSEYNDLDKAIEDYSQIRWGSKPLGVVKFVYNYAYEMYKITK